MERADTCIRGIALHRVVEVLYKLPHGLFAAEFIVKGWYHNAHNDVSENEVFFLGRGVQQRRAVGLRTAQQSRCTVFPIVLACCYFSV